MLLQSKAKQIIHVSKELQIRPGLNDLTVDQIKELKNDQLTISYFKKNLFVEVKSEKEEESKDILSSKKKASKIKQDAEQYCLEKKLEADTYYKKKKLEADTYYKKKKSEADIISKAKNA